MFQTKAGLPFHLKVRTSRDWRLQGLTNPDPAVRTKLEKDPNAESFKLENNSQLFQIELDALSALRPDELRYLLEKSVDEHFDEYIYLSVIS